MGEKCPNCGSTDTITRTESYVVKKSGWEKAAGVAAGIAIGLITGNSGHGAHMAHNAMEDDKQTHTYNHCCNCGKDF